MRKIPMREAQMSEAVYVEQATTWARELTHTESRGPGDMENAWRRLEAKYGIPPRMFWSLRYRPPKEIGVALWFRLRAAYEHECERQMRKLRHELEITKTIAGPDCAAVVEAQAVVDSDD